MLFRIALFFMAFFVLIAPASAQNPAALIQATGTNLCLDVPNGDYRPGVRVQLYPCHGGDNQRFFHGDMQAGKMPIMIHGLCLDAFRPEGGPARAGDTVGLYTCQGSNNQQWYFSYYGWSNVPPTGLPPQQAIEIIDGPTAYCLDVPNGNFQPGTPPIIWPCHFGPNEMWTLHVYSYSLPPQPQGPPPARKGFQPGDAY